MELNFNELSLFHKASSEAKAVSILQKFVLLCKKTKEQKFVKLNTENTFWTSLLFDRFNILELSNKISKPQKSFLLSYIRKPYLTENETEHDEQYILNNYSLAEKSVSELYQKEVVGLAYSFLQKTLSISLCTHSLWHKKEIEIYEDNTSSLRKCKVRHACNLNTLEIYKDWLESNQPIVLRTTNKSPDSKPIKLRDDHGKDTLEAFAKKSENLNMLLVL